MIVGSYVPPEVHLAPSFVSRPTAFGSVFTMGKWSRLRSQLRQNPPGSPGTPRSACGFDLSGMVSNDSNNGKEIVVSYLNTKELQKLLTDGLFWRIWYQTDVDKDTARKLLFLTKKF